MSYSRGVLTLIFSIAVVAVFVVVFQICTDVFVWLPFVMTGPLVSGIAVIVYYVIYDFLEDAP